MKSWYEWQLKNQVVNHDWNSAGDPCGNAWNDIGHYFDQLKDLYAQDKLHAFGGAFFGDEYLKDIKVQGYTDQEIRELYMTDADKEILQKSHIDRLGIPENIKDQLKIYFSEKFNLELEGQFMAIHLQLPGEFIVYHFDRPKSAEYCALYVANAAPVALKYLIFMEDLHPGHAFQMGNRYITWNKGDVFTWNQRDVPHGSANFGHVPRLVFRVHGKIKKPVDITKQ
jgi:hypothetical protein